jgi:hypothetical protein
VTGGSGSGKSALFAALHKRLADDESIVLLAHAAGITPRAGQVDAMLRRWVGELAAMLGIATPPGEDAAAAEVEKTFHEYLGRASAQRRVVVLIDALNQFEAGTRARYLTWLPKLWPPNARLIATTIPGTESAALDERAGMELEALPPLAEGDARQIMAAVCKRYHREPFHRDIVEAVLAGQRADRSAAAGNPLWLNLAVEELNLLDADDFARAERDYAGLRADQRLHQLVLDTAQRLPADVEGMYGWLLERTEQVYGAHWAKAFASLTAVSRFGWREADLRVLVPVVARLFHPERRCDDWDDLTFASLRRGFRAHLRQRGAQGQWDFFHVQMRAAVHRRNLGDAQLIQGIHAAVAGHLLALAPDDVLHQRETLVHLIGADDRERAALFYASALNDAELAGATRALADHILAEEAVAANPGLAWVNSLLDLEALPADAVGQLGNRWIFDLSDAIANEAKLGTSRAVAEAARGRLERLAAADPSNAGWQRDLSVSHERIGDVLRAQGDLGGALQAYRADLAVAERLAAADPSNAGWQRDVMVSCWRMADMAEKSGDGDAQRWWKQAYETLSAMQQRGIMLPTDEPYLEALRSKAGVVVPGVPVRSPEGQQTSGGGGSGEKNFAPTDATARRTVAPEARHPPGAAGVSRPHPGADPERATRLNLAYQHALAAWQALPFWKRMITKKPAPPSGI